MPTASEMIATAKKPGLIEINEVEAEGEVQALLYALICVLKPKIAVETGCYFGGTTWVMAQAIKTNKYGKLYSCDINDAYVEATHRRLTELGSYGRWASVVTSTGVGLPQLAQADFIFSDSDYACRQAEIQAAKPGAVIVVHDTSVESHKYNPSAPFLGDVVRKHGGLTFEAGRGFGIIVKKNA